MEKFKRYKGITLISLIITIIILIILAGISISMILGNEGLLNKAKYAKESYSNAQQQEELELAKYNNQINNYVSGNRDYTPISYSIDEQDTRITWIDGKKIYQKIINITLPSSSGSTEYTFDVANANIISITPKHIYDNTSNQISCTFPWFDIANGSLLGAITKISGNKYEIYVTRNRSDVNLVALVEYTKSTD